MRLGKASQMRLYNSGDMRAALGPLRTTLSMICLLALAACGSSSGSRDFHPLPKQGNYKLGKPYQISGIWYYPEFDPDYDRQGTASWYGADFHGLPTANGEVFDRHLISAAHTTLPLPSIVEVTNLENGKNIVLRVNDRGPFHDNRIIDLSEAAARKLGFHGNGLAQVRVRFLRLADDAKGTPPKPSSVTASHQLLPSDKAVAAIEPAAAASNTYVCSVDEQFVQVAALSDLGRVQALEARLSGLGPVWHQTLKPPSGPIHRVRIGPLADRRNAFDVLSKLRQLGYQEAYVTDCSSIDQPTS